MNNYEYIIASLPVLSQRDSSIDTDGLISQIREQLSSRDICLFDFLLDGFDGDKLTEEFYHTAFASRNRFIREFFSFDLNVRNAKVRYLNSALGRPDTQDVMNIQTGEFPELPKVHNILVGRDLLARERGLDNLMWKKVEQICEMEIFSLDRILSLVCKIKIIDRWVKLDEKTGRELFRKLVEEIKETYKA